MDMKAEFAESLNTLSDNMETMLGEMGTLKTEISDLKTEVASLQNKCTAEECERRPCNKIKGAKKCRVTAGCAWLKTADSAKCVFK